MDISCYSCKKKLEFKDYQHAKIAYFYGWTDGQIDQLSVDKIDLYWQAITTIEAQEMLKQLTVSDWPHLKQNQRETIHRRLFQDAYPASFKETKQLETADLARILGG